MDPAIQPLFNVGQAKANAAYAAAKRNVTIDPITRLEGHGKIDIYLDDKGDVERAYFQVPELRGFEVFCRGRPAEDMPQITSRIRLRRGGPAVPPRHRPGVQQGPRSGRSRA